MTPPGRPPLWSRFLKLLGGAVMAFATAALAVLAVWLLIYFGLRYFLPDSNWEGSALFATLITALFAVQMLGEAVVETVFRSMCWGAKALWRRLRS